MAATPQYKWSHPLEWLYDEIDSKTDVQQLRDIARQLATVLDGDQIQDLFQDEMDADGYFDPLDEASS